MEKIGHKVAVSKFLFDAMNFFLVSSENANENINHVLEWHSEQDISGELSIRSHFLINSGAELHFNYPRRLVEVP